MNQQQKQNRFLFELDQIFNPPMIDVVDDLKQEMAEMLIKTLIWITQQQTKHFNQNNDICNDDAK